MDELSVQPEVRFVVDTRGRKRQVMLSLKDYRALLEAVEELNDIHALEAAIDAKPKLVPLCEV
jgi:hypothetical protein